MKSTTKVIESIKNRNETHKRNKKILRCKKKIIKLHPQKKLSNHLIIRDLKFDEDEICLVPSSIIVFEDDVDSIVTLSDL